ncbi:hypothetical protein ACFQ08_33190 [Streptosporangium algeriense]|uniref:Uncharacterized protein n=1 Tax=Streptosporangium algeriense TaxID=1682748 RepID=A0ABW3E2W0_9ACTN
MPEDTRETISYQRTGGLAGIRQTLVVDRNGLARGTSAGTARTFRLTPAELGLLRRAVASIRTWSSSTAGCDIPDHFAYTLEYHGRRATRCHEPPADWRPAITRLDEVITRHVIGPPASPGG